MISQKCADIVVDIIEHYVDEDEIDCYTIKLGKYIIQIIKECNYTIPEIIQIELDDRYGFVYRESIKYINNIIGSDCAKTILDTLNRNRELVQFRSVP